VHDKGASAVISQGNTVDESPHFSSILEMMIEEENIILSNAPEWSVSELSGALRRTVEDTFGHVRVRGEISGYRGPHSSGHAYFALKDTDAKIDAVIWRGVFSKLKFRPEEGLEVVATGKLTTYAGKSSYQLVIEQLEPAGLGALMVLLEERRKRLTLEGLFDQSRKKPLPYLPKTIAVVTSPTGSVIRDILHRLEDRFPCHVIVWPVRVQGETSAQEVSQSLLELNYIDGLQGIPRPDLIIIARGGGSLEDLWGFNEESVIRAADHVTIPIISAVGHETDWTLLDLVADVRAPTPTAAAEMAVPVRSDLLAAHAALSARLRVSKSRFLIEKRKTIRALERALPSAQDHVHRQCQRLDISAVHMKRRIDITISAQRKKVQDCSGKLAGQTPRAYLARMVERMKGLGLRLEQTVRKTNQDKYVRLSSLHSRLSPERLREKIDFRSQSIQRAHHRLKSEWNNTQRQKRDRLALQHRLAETLSHKAVLARGFALVINSDGAPVRSVKEAIPHKLLCITFADGSLDVLNQASSAGYHAVQQPLKSPKKPENQAGFFDDV
jgi:exodeoxyribonuclease VII large subunit